MFGSESVSRVGSSSNAAAWAHGTEQYVHAQMRDSREGQVATHPPRRALVQARSALPEHGVEAPVRRSDAAHHDGRACTHSNRAHASGSKQAPPERAFINGWAVPSSSWLTPSPETRAAEQDSSFCQPWGPGLHADTLPRHRGRPDTQRQLDGTDGQRHCGLLRLKLMGRCDIAGCTVCLAERKD